MRKALLVGPLLFAAVAAAGGQRVARLTEDLRLDATTEDFPTVRQVAIGPRGQIVVGIPRENTLRIYDGSGKKLGVVGRLGSGPGEFRGIGAIGWIGDTMWVDDSQLRRTSYFAPDLKPIRTVPREATQIAGAATPEGMRSGVYFSPYVVYGDGSMLGDARIAKSTKPAEPWERAVVFRDALGQLTRAKGTPRFEDPRWGEMFYAGFSKQVPFMMGPAVAWSWDGSRYGFLTVDNTARDGGVMTLSLYRRDGSVEFQNAIPFKGVTIPGSVRDSALAAFIPPPGRPTEGPSDLAQRFQSMARDRMPSFYAPAEGLILGLDNTIWIMHPTRNDQWSAEVLDGRGRSLGIVQTPKKARIRHGTATHVYVTQRDEDDLISVVRYRIAWP